MALSKRGHARSAPRPDERAPDQTGWVGVRIAPVSAAGVGQRDHHPAIASGVRFAAPSAAVRLPEAVYALLCPKPLSSPSAGGSAETEYDPDPQSLNDCLVDRPARLKQSFLVCHERRFRRRANEYDVAGRHRSWITIKRRKHMQNPRSHAPRPWWCPVPTLIGIV